MKRYSPAKKRIHGAFGESVRIIRELQELSQNQLARLTGISQATISAIENDRVRLGVERAKVLARALKCHPGVLVFPGREVRRRRGMTIRSSRRFVTALGLLAVLACSRPPDPPPPVAPPAPRASERPAALSTASGGSPAHRRSRRHPRRIPLGRHPRDHVAGQQAHGRVLVRTEDGLVMVEESIPYRVDILTLDDDEFVIRSHNPGAPVDIAMVPADSVDPP